MTERSRTGLGIILLTVFLDLVGFSIIFPLFPAMLEHYLAIEGEGSLLATGMAWLRDTASGAGENAELYTIVLFGGILGSLYSLLQFVASPLWGTLSDRIGRRPVLVVTIAGTALSYLLWVFAGNFSLLVLSRTLGGAMAGNLSVATASIADVTDAKNRAKGMGLLGAAFGVGFIFGPAIGGLLSTFRIDEWFAVSGLNPFSASALGAFVLAVVNWVWVWRRFDETLPASRRGASQTQRTFNVVALFKPLPFPGVSHTNLVYFAFILSFSGMEFTLTFLAHDRFHYTPLQNTLLFLFTGVIVALVQGGLVRRLAPRLGERKLAVLGLALLVPGLATIGLAPTEALLYLGLGLLAVGSAFTNPSLSALVSLYSPESHQGQALGIFRSLGALARAIGPLIAASLYWQLGSVAPYVGGAAWMFLPLLLGLRLPAVPEQKENAS